MKLLTNIAGAVSRNISTILLYLFLILIHLYHPIDFDLGWHLRYGEYITQHLTVLRTNTFSTMMAGYNWVNATSGTDLLTYLLYKAGGFPALSVAGAIIISCIYYIFARTLHFSLLQKLILFPLLTIVTRPHTVISFRGQLLSLFFIALLCWILVRSERKYKTILWTPLLFLFWANVHGQVIVGFAVFTIWLIFKLLTVLAMDKPDTKMLLLLLTSYSVSWVMSIINPYGIGTIIEPLLYIGNQNIRAIAEWNPYPIFSADWIYLVISGFFITIATILALRKQNVLHQLPWIIVAFILLGFALAQRRYAWMYYFLSLPVLHTLIPETFPRLRHGIRQTIMTGACFILFLVGTLSARNNFGPHPMTWKSYCSVIGCSESAAVFLLDHGWQPPIFTVYNWGGWLIWRYPAIKPSIDGRMSLWQTSDGYSAFAEYYSWEQDITDIDASPYNTVFTSRYKPIYKKLRKLEQNGSWIRIYEDNAASIFVRTK